MTPQELANALGGAKQESDGWYGLCPIHGDTNPSVCINEKDDRILWVCRAGCDQKQLTDHILGILKDSNGSGGGKGKSKIVATYDYTDEGGALLFQVCRMDPKSFRQRRPDPDNPGEWIWKLGQTRKVLFHLPAIAESTTVIIAEGEKDVLALEALGLPATCNAGGAGKWFAGYSESLRGKKVAIIADNDLPGQNHAATVAGHLITDAKSVRILSAPEPHKDASDWIDAGATAETIIDAIKATPELTPDTLPVFSMPTGTEETPKGTYEPGPWRKGLLVSEKGPRSLLANALQAVRASRSLKGLLAFDDFTQRATFRRKPPWARSVGDRWGDSDDAHLTEWLQHNDIRVGTDISARAAYTLARELRFDSLKDYLNGLTWDGMPRLHTVGEMIGGGPGLPCELMKLFMISAAARGLSPGEKVDHIIVLEGPQGARKSTALQTLFDPLGKNWFRDDLPPLDSKDSAIQLQGAWCIEIAELEAINSKRVEIEKIKAYLTRTKDSFRPPYARHTEDIPRRSVFAGSTNETAYLKDSTGNRRFWPISCVNKIDITALEVHREQLWAEAVTAYLNGETWWVDSATPKYEAIMEAQEARRIIDPWENTINMYLRHRTVVTMEQIFDHLNVKLDKRSQLDSNRVGRHLRSLGWMRRRYRLGTTPGWYYVSHPGVEVEEVQGAMDALEEEQTQLRGYAN